ncbi:MAG: hypothetical protein RIT19_548 [Verrucomicrobiota bacterium]|jgi:uncharacterized membrane protein
MYRILGSDGNEYGPASSEQLGQWIRERRVDGDTRVQGDDGQWRPLREVPELAGLLQPPPPIPPPVPPMMPESAQPRSVPSDFDGDYDLDIVDCLTSAWRLFQQRFSTLFGPTMMYVLISFGLAVFGALPYIGPLFSLFSAIIGGPLLAGLYVVYLRVIRGETPPLESVFDGFRRMFGHLFLGQWVTAILASLPLLAGFIVLFFSVGLTVIMGLAKGSASWPAFEVLAPGLALALLGFPVTVFLTVNWMFSLPLILDQRLDFWTAMKRSWRQVRRHWWSCLALLVLMSILNFAGMMCCLVGLIVTFPISMLALMHAYETVIHGRKVQ